MVTIRCELLRVIYKPLIKVLRWMYAYCSFKPETKFSNRKQVGCTKSSQWLPKMIFSGALLFPEAIAIAESFFLS